MDNLKEKLIANAERQLGYAKEVLSNNDVEWSDNYLSKDFSPELDAGEAENFQYYLGGYNSLMDFISENKL